MYLRQMIGGRWLLRLRMDPDRQGRVRWALDLLRRFAPAELQHAMRELEGITYLPGGCGEGATACTLGPFGRWAVLATDPLTTSIVDLAVSIYHEALHHYTLADGTHYEVPHTCRDCTDPAERAADPIYIRQEELQARLVVSIAYAAREALLAQQRAAAAQAAAQWWRDVCFGN